MLASLGYSTVVLQSGVAFLQAVAPLTADRPAWVVPADLAAVHQVWSDRTFKFIFTAPRSNALRISEEQSKSLHKALIASFDVFIAPILIS